MCGFRNDFMQEVLSPKGGIVEMDKGLYGNERPPSLYTLPTTNSYPKRGIYSVLLIWLNFGAACNYSIQRLSL